MKNILTLLIICLTYGAQAQVNVRATNGITYTFYTAAQTDAKIAAAVKAQADKDALARKVITDSLNKYMALYNAMPNLDQNSMPVVNGKVTINYVPIIKTADSAAKKAVDLAPLTQRVISNETNISTLSQQVGKIDITVKNIDTWKATATIDVGELIKYTNKLRGLVMSVTLPKE